MAACSVNGWFRAQWVTASTATVLLVVDTESVVGGRLGSNLEIGFLRAKEYSMDLEFREQFIWSVPAVLVGLDFWFDEAVEQYWIHSIQPCPCAH